MKEMKKSFVMAVFVAGITLLSAGMSVARAEEESKTFFDLFPKLGLEASGDVSYSSIYEWRGIMLDGDPVIQPGFYIWTKPSKYGRIKFSYWMSRDLENRDALKSSETDYIVDYTYNFDYVDASFGHTYYDFPDVVPSDGAPKGFSREFYWGLTFPKVFLTPSIFYYYDYGKKEDGGGEGSYLVLNAAYSMPFTVKNVSCSLDLNGHVGANNKLYFRGKGGDFGMTVGVTVPLTKSLSIKPNVSYAVPWGNLRDTYNGNQKNRVYSGVYMSYVF